MQVSSEQLPSNARTEKKKVSVAPRIINEHQESNLFKLAAAFNLPSRGGDHFPKTRSKDRALARSSQLPSSLRHPVIKESSLATPGKQDGLGRASINMKLKREEFVENYVEAKKRILESLRLSQGPRHPETLVALNEYAIAMGKQEGRRAEAKPVLKEALLLSREVNGPRHPETLQALKNYEDLFGPRPVVAAWLKLGLKGYYRNIAVGSVLVAAVLWLLKFVTKNIDILANAFGPVGASCSSPIAAIVAGFCAGALHTLSGPDHLAALAPLALRKKNPSGAFLTGVYWGIAHVVGQVLLGLSLLTASRSSFVMDIVSQSGLAQHGEQLAAVAVGAVLIAIGALGFKEIQEWNEEDDADAHDTSSGTIRTFLTGMLAGMQPDALLFCLPALTLPSRLAGILFLTSFGGGTLLSMGGFTAALQAACVSFGQQAVKRVAAFSSVVAITLGVIVSGSAIGIPLLRGLF